MRNFKSTIFATALLASGHAYAAEESCADFLGAAKSDNIESLFNSYMSGIGDMGMVDASVYRKRFFDAPSEGGQKNGKQWMLQRAYSKCITSPLSTKLSDVIKVTM
jgi:hypothetical protein